MNVELIRSFLLIAELGSLSAAAGRLRVSQSTLTRQLQALEHEVGGALFERSSTGVAPTAAGNALAKSVRPALEALEHALAEARRLARGQSETLRIGYLQSAAPEYLNPALAALRKAHPEVKVKLLDRSPGEQLAALRSGELDLAMLGNVGGTLAREFYVRRVAALPVWVALAETHPLAGRATVRLAELRTELFVGALESDLPGYNRWVMQLARKAGFRPKFLGDADSLTHGLALVVSDGAVSLLPKFAAQGRVPGIAFRPLADEGARWELLLAWQRGKMTAPLKAMLDQVAVGVVLQRQGRDGQRQAVDVVVGRGRAHGLAQQPDEGAVQGLDFAVQLLLPQAGGVQHLAKVQAHAQLHLVAHVQRAHEAGEELLQKNVQRIAVGPGIGLQRPAQWLGIGRVVQALLVAKVIADEGGIGPRRFGDLADGGLGKPVFGKQPQCGAEQPCARVGRVGRGGGRVGGWNHGAGLHHGLIN